MLRFNDEKSEIRHAEPPLFDTSCRAETVEASEFELIHVDDLNTDVIVDDIDAYSSVPDIWLALVTSDSVDGENGSRRSR